MAAAGRIEYKIFPPYNQKVLIGNWFEDRCRFKKDKRDYMSVYMQDYDPKPISKLDPNIMWDRIFQGGGYGERLLFDHDGDNYKKNLATTYDLSYNHFPKWFIEKPFLRKYRSRMERWEPCQDFAKIYGNITDYGIVAYKKELWADDKLDPRLTSKSLYEDSYLPPTNEDLKFKRFGIPLVNSSIMNKSNKDAMVLNLRNMPMNSVTANEDLVVVPYKRRCNPITWECQKEEEASHKLTC